MSDLKDKIKVLSKEYLKEVINIRRHIHANPELSFQEFETSKYIQSLLDDIGVSYTTGWVKTGIVVTIEGKNPEKKCIALRADFDALPIKEQNQIDYKSKNEGVMHACGHDVHASCLLGVIKITHQLKEEFEGTIQFIFQPGEEKLPGGASLMLKEGVFNKGNPDAIIAQHVFPELEVGKVGFRGGMYMASCDEVYIKVKGKGGHGAMPQKCIDPVSISAQLIVALQQIVSRNCPPAVPCVLSFGKIIADGATNVIPDDVIIEGTFRTMNEEWRVEAHERILNTSHQLVESLGAICEVEVKRGYPYLMNDPEKTMQSKKLAEEFLGSENVVELPLRMTGEDFSYFSHQVPACFYRLGTRNEKEGLIHGVHNAQFNIDESAIEIGMGLMAYLAMNSK